MPEVLFGTQSYVSRSLPLSAMRMVNCFLEKQVAGAKSQTAIFGAPGLTAFSLLPAGPVRGFWNFNGTLYAVAGQNLYSVSPTGGALLIGTGIGGTGVVSMSDNGIQLIIVNGVGGWIYGPNYPFQMITSPNFYPANTVIFFDGYFVLDRVGTNQFFLSALYDGTTYNGDAFASAEAQPGFLIATAQNLQLLFLFCQNHIELWYDAGVIPQPFQRYAGGVIERGLASPHALVLQDDALFFLGTDGIFYRLQGNVPIRVSQHAVEHAIQNYGNISDAFCFTYTLEGHKMVHLTFPSAPHSWVYDISTGLWHEKESWGPTNLTLHRWRGNCAIQIYGKILIGDSVTGQISFLDWNNFTELGNIMAMVAHSAPVQKDKLRVFINRLELDMQTGWGITPSIATPTDPSTAPQAQLSWSKDGGRTFGTIQAWRSLGKIGEYLARLRWISLGQAYQFVFRLTITDPVPRVLIATHSDIEVGDP
jgi:hypothetical protein